MQWFNKTHDESSRYHNQLWYVKTFRQMYYFPLFVFQLVCGFFTYNRWRFRLFNMENFGYSSNLIPLEKYLLIIGYWEGLKFTLKWKLAEHQINIGNYISSEEYIKKLGGL